MNPDRMRSRGVNFYFRQPALLRNHGLRFNKVGWASDAGFANVVPSPGEIVEGVLYNINKDGLDMLDRFEGHPREYQRQTKKVELFGEVVSAEVYVACTNRISGSVFPTVEYLDDLLAGADLLSPEYVEQLATLRWGLVSEQLRITGRSRSSTGLGG